MSDIAEIHQLYARYARQFDSGEIAAWAECFRPDGLLASSSGATARGSAEIIEFGERLSAGLKGRHKHWYNQIYIEELTENTARSSCYTLLLDVGETPPRMTWSGTYRDELVREDTCWRFTSRVSYADADPIK